MKINTKESTTDAPASRLRSFVVTRGQFKNKGEFIAFCSRNKVNGSWTLLWQSFSFTYSIRLFTAFTTEPVKWED